MNSISHRVLEGRSRGYYGLLAVLAVLVIAGLWAAHYMESNGHHVTGMSNQIVFVLNASERVKLYSCELCVRTGAASLVAAEGAAESPSGSKPMSSG